jgi:glycosyltransferase involved in cell wall biosynthesis
MTADPTAQTTVVLPVWGEYVAALPEALASLRAQDVAAPMIAVDNASDAQLPDLPGVTLVRSPRRLTLGAARNLGLAHVTTPYVVVWDADDVMLPGTLDFLEAAIRSDPRLAAFGAAIVEEPSAVRHRWPRRWVAALVRAPKLFALLNSVWSLYPTTGATVMRTELVRGAGGYSDAESGDDWCLGVSLAFRGRIGWSERPGRVYRLHPQSVWARHMTARHLLRHARTVRARIRTDPGIGGWAKALLPLVAGGQVAAVIGHVVLSAARNLRARPTNDSRRR